jgi:hypothetical protein
MIILVRILFAWFRCKARVVGVIEPTLSEVEEYRKEQVAKGEAENNDYLK